MHNYFKYYSLQKNKLKKMKSKKLHEGIRNPPKKKTPNQKPTRNKKIKLMEQNELKQKYNLITQQEF